MKKGQITVFIIIGVILLLSLAVVYYVTREGPVEEALELQNQISPIHDYLEDCITGLAMDGLYLSFLYALPSESNQRYSLKV